MDKLECFKAYDIRGKVPEEIDVSLAYKIGCAYADIIDPGTVIVGYDVRLESPLLAEAVINGLMDCGVNVINIGLCGTEEVYFQTFHKEKDGIGGGIMITASHNPKGYNGMKMVKQGSRPMSGADDLKKIHDYVLANKKQIRTLSSHGQQVIQEDKSEYIEHLLGYINVAKIKPLRIVVNPGNGPAGAVINLLEKYLPCEFIYICEEADGNFPNGVPNPMLIENRVVTSDAVIAHKADLGVAWDGDFDRCFVFDEKGNFIEGYYIVGLLAASFLSKAAGSKIIHDPRLVWNTQEIVKKAGGIAVQSKSGHSFIKEKMREENAIYGGEMSAHHYFRDFAYCDSGMLPWLLIAELLSDSEDKLSVMVAKSQDAYPCSGEINYKVANVSSTLRNIEDHFKHQGAIIDYIDGISLEFSDWRFNVRGSNTEPLLRLNLEVKGKDISIEGKIAEIEAIIMSTT
ncbi:MAG: phosphomannomutase CpsG [Rickettsiaceae bacterium]|nr:phosphomannomutase CpsG [Rickettsiaceae bacterium]MDP5082689.1 phosphomannomutase CpsG [Rickettsiaceae bacterium]